MPAPMTTTLLVAGAIALSGGWGIVAAIAVSLAVAFQTSVFVLGGTDVG